MESSLKYAGPALDALVASKVMGTEIKPYSTETEFAAEVITEINERGYAFDFFDDDGVTCTLTKDGQKAVNVWGLTYE